MEEQLKQLIEQAKAANNSVLVAQLTQALNTVLASKKEQPSTNTIGTLPREPAIAPVWGADYSTAYFQESEEKETTPVRTEEEKEEIRKKLRESEERVRQQLEWAKQQPNEPEMTYTGDLTNLPDHVKAEIIKRIQSKSNVEISEIDSVYQHGNYIVVDAKQSNGNFIGSEFTIRDFAELVHHANTYKQNTKQKEDIKKVANGEVSKLITTKNNNNILESKYMDTPSHAKNSKLRTELNSILVTLALDDITKQQKGAMKICSLLDTFEEPEDIEDIQQFLEDISKIGRVGLETKEAVISAYSNRDKQKEIYTKYFDDQYEDLTKSLNLADMELDEINNKSLKDTKDLEDMKTRYQIILQKLEKLYDETARKIDDKKSQELKKTIEYVKEQIENIKSYGKSLEDIEEFVNQSFNI